MQREVYWTLDTQGFQLHSVCTPCLTLPNTQKKHQRAKRKEQDSTFFTVKPEFS